MVRAGLSEEVTFVLKRMRSYQPEQKLTKGIADRGKSKCNGPGAGKNFPCTKYDGLDIS